MPDLRRPLMSIPTHNHLVQRTACTRRTRRCNAARTAVCAMGFALPMFLASCGGSSSSDGTLLDPIQPIDPDNSTSCETAVQNQWAYNNMLDYYLFYDQVPVVDPQSFESAADLVRAVRFEERDSFSSVTDAGTATLQFEQGREFGLGFSWAYDDSDVARITRSSDDGPFGRAGLERGDILISVNEIAWDDLTADAFSEIAKGTPDAPATSRWQIEKRDSGEIVNLELTAAEYSINTVLHTQAITNTNYSGKIGYLVFSRFLETSAPELLSAFEFFRSENVTDLVVDLRYNRGGRVVIAEQLASLIAGNARANQPLLNYIYNDKYTAENYSLFLQDGVGDLNLSRIIFITRGQTASSSEIVIGGLQPYMEVVTIGDTTSGKPYVQRGRTRCGRQLNAIEAEGFNAAGVSVFGGVAANCYAKDDPTRDFGFNPDTGELEGMARAAFDYVVFGTCNTEPTQAIGSARARSGIISNSANESLDKQGMFDIGGAFR